MRPYSVGAPTAAGTRRLHLNEYRGEHPEAVGAAVRAAAGGLDVARYEAGVDPGLVADLAAYVGVGAENVLVAAGSDEVLRAIIDTCGLPAVVMGEPGYTHFRHYAALRGLAVEAYAIGLETSPADHEAALRYHAPRMRSGALVYLCSPNNPTGDMWGLDTVSALAAEFPASLFLVDEAYVEYASAFSELFPMGDASLDPAEAREAVRAKAARCLNACSLAGLAVAHANIVVTRTMSKAFGLAALRVGYAVAAAETVARIGVAVSPKAMNPLAAPAARAALREAAHYLVEARDARARAHVTVGLLRDLGWYALETPGNFYLVYAGDAEAVTAALAAAGVAVRNRDELPGLAGFVRVTAGAEADHRAVLEAFLGLKPPAAPPPQSLYTRKGVVARVKGLMRRVVAVLREAGVEFWAQSGTMLGMYRHGGMVPWDDDGDLAYARVRGVDALAPLVPVFAAAGLTLQRNRTDAYWQAGTNTPGGTISPVHIDIFSYRIEHDGRGPYTYTLDDERFAVEEPENAQAHCNTQYSHDDLYPLRHDYAFYDIPIPMPARAGEVLRRSLGAGFMTTARVRVGEDRPCVEFALRDASPA